MQSLNTKRWIEYRRPTYIHTLFKKQAPNHIFWQKFCSWPTRSLKFGVSLVVDPTVNASEVHTTQYPRHIYTIFAHHIYHLQSRWLMTSFFNRCGRVWSLSYLELKWIRSHLYIYDAWHGGLNRTKSMLVAPCLFSRTCILAVFVMNTTGFFGFGVSII